MFSVNAGVAHPVADYRKLYQGGHEYWSFIVEQVNLVSSLCLLILSALHDPAEPAYRHIGKLDHDRWQGLIQRVQTIYQLSIPF